MCVHFEEYAKCASQAPVQLLPTTCLHPNVLASPGGCLYCTSLVVCARTWLFQGFACLLQRTSKPGSQKKNVCVFVEHAHQEPLIQAPIARHDSQCLASLLCFDAAIQRREHGQVSRSYLTFVHRLSQEGWFDIICFLAIVRVRTVCLKDLPYGHSEHPSLACPT